MAANGERRSLAVRKPERSRRNLAHVDCSREHRRLRPSRTDATDSHHIVLWRTINAYVIIHGAVHEEELWPPTCKGHLRQAIKISKFNEPD